MAKKKGEVSPVGPPKAPTDRVPIRPRGGDLMVNLNSHVASGVTVLNLGGVQYITLIPNSTVKLDCGVDVEPDQSFELVLRPVDEMAQQGVILANAGSAVEGRIGVYLTNAGKNTVAITHGQVVARIALVPFEPFTLGGQS